MKKTVYIKHRLDNIIDVTKIVTMHYFELSKDYTYSGESHDFWEIVYVDKGQVEITADNEEFTLSQGQMRFHKPMEFHALRSNGKDAPNVLIVTFECKSAPMELLFDKTLTVPKKLKGIISDIMLECSNTFDLPAFNPDLKKLELLPNAPIGSQQMIRLLLEQLLIYLIRDINGTTLNYKLFNSQDDLNDHLTNHIVKMINDHIYDSLTIEQICHSVNFGKTYVCTTFKNVTGHSIMDFYAKAKISQAKRMIRQENMNFSQIAEKLHFSDPHHFYRTFKKHTGMTPKQYKQSIITS